MSMKLSPIMSPTGLGFREYNSWLFQLIIISRPQQRKLTLTPSTPPGGNHIGKATALTSLLTSCKNGGGAGRDTLPRGQDAIHTGQQHGCREGLPLP